MLLLTIDVSVARVCVLPEYLGLIDRFDTFITDVIMPLVCNSYQIEYGKRHSPKII